MIKERASQFSLTFFLTMEEKMPTTTHTSPSSISISLFTYKKIPKNKTILFDQELAHMLIYPSVIGVACVCCRLLCSSSLRKLSAGHNRLQKLPDRVERPLLEILDVQHNQLVELPSHLFLKSERYNTP